MGRALSTSSLGDFYSLPRLGTNVQGRLARIEAGVKAAGLATRDETVLLINPGSEPHVRVNSLGRARKGESVPSENQADPHGCAGDDRGASESKGRKHGAL